MTDNLPSLCAVCGGSVSNEEAWPLEHFSVTCGACWHEAEEIVMPLIQMRVDAKGLWDPAMTPLSVIREVLRFAARKRQEKP